MQQRLNAYIRAVHRRKLLSSSVYWCSLLKDRHLSLREISDLKPSSFPLQAARHRMKDARDADSRECCPTAAWQVLLIRRRRPLWTRKLIFLRHSLLKCSTARWLKVTSPRALRRRLSLIPTMKIPGLEFGQTDVSSYRHRCMSNLPVLSKLLERLVVRQLMDHLKSADLLPANWISTRPLYRNCRSAGVGRHSLGCRPRRRGCFDPFGSLSSFRYRHPRDFVERLQTIGLYLRRHFVLVLLAFVVLGLVSSFIHSFIHICLMSRDRTHSMQWVS